MHPTHSCHQGPFHRKPFLRPAPRTDPTPQERSELVVLHRQADPAPSPPSKPQRGREQLAEQPSPSQCDISFSLSFTDHHLTPNRTALLEEEDLLEGLNNSDSLDAVGHSPPQSARPSYSPSLLSQEMDLGCSRKREQPSTICPNSNNTSPTQYTSAPVLTLRPVSPFTLEHCQQLPPSGLTVALTPHGFTITYSSLSLAAKTLSQQFQRPPPGEGRFLHRRLRLHFGQHPLTLVAFYASVMVAFEEHKLARFLLSHNIRFNGSEKSHFETWLGSVLDACHPHEAVEWLFFAGPDCQHSVPTPPSTALSPHSNFWKFVAPLALLPAPQLVPVLERVGAVIAGLVDRQ